MYASGRSRLWAEWRRKGVASQTVDYIVNCMNLLDAWLLRSCPFWISYTISTRLYVVSGGHKSRSLNFVRRRWNAFYYWLCVSDSVVPGDWTTTVDLCKMEMDRNLRLTICNWLSCPTARPWLLVYVRCKTSSWELISRIYPVVDRLRWGRRIEVCFFYRVLCETVGPSRVLGPRLLLGFTQQCRRSLPFQLSWTVITYTSSLDLVAIFI